ncbi:phosphoglucosamine mutase [Arenibacter certesii]|uniref:Phosphoglucosamine mutase n=2 Tax=Arenibacter certesii TaxID=228955 RepID=A0A918MIW2_9FLAO|nr:phosphoglucosamine mutase [Arenibacter certesii]
MCQKIHTDKRRLLRTNLQLRAIVIKPNPLYLYKLIIVKMTLIKSISGIRGTIGGKPGDNLTPIDAVKFAAAYGIWLKDYSKKEKLKVVIGRDARLSGEMIQNLVVSTLVGLGIDIIDLDLSTTPTVEIAVPLENADGGIILTASHNPKQWNALKLLNEKGEFLDAEQGAKILEIAAEEAFVFAEVDDLGTITRNDSYIDIHIDEVLNLSLVDADVIRAAKFKVVVDGVNSTGGIAIPKLLRELGVEVVELYCEPTGHFPHNPEPLKEHLGDICELVVKEKADFGIVVDPDVDRLAFITNEGEMFGEEYTLVACADYVLGKTKGNTVSNLSSSRALRDITQKHGGTYEASAVGEVNVVTLMKKNKAIIGGEGNGGIIYPESHYGRDSLVGTALFLMLMAEKGGTVSELRASYPSYFMSKKKIELTPGLDVDGILTAMAEKYKNEEISTIDGVKIDFPENWVHLRKSNTEPIIRIYTEAKSQADADTLADRIIGEIKAVAGL